MLVSLWLSLRPQPQVAPYDKKHPLDQPQLVPSGISPFSFSSLRQGGPFGEEIELRNETSSNAQSLNTSGFHPTSHSLIPHLPHQIHTPRSPLGLSGRRRAQEHAPQSREVMVELPRHRPHGASRRDRLSWVLWSLQVRGLEVNAKLCQTQPNKTNHPPPPKPPQTSPTSQTSTNLAKPLQTSPTSASLPNLPNLAKPRQTSPNLPKPPQTSPTSQTSPNLPKPPRTSPIPQILSSSPLPLHQPRETPKNSPEKR